MNSPLAVEHRDVAKNLLHSLNLPSTGAKRNTQYFILPDCIFSPLKENDMKKGEFIT